MTKVLLIIRDGWGYRKSKQDNLIANTKLPFTEYLMSTFPNVLLDASGGEVGLPKNYQGNSEVGHMTIGSGRIILQSLSRINKSIESGDFEKNKSINSAIANCKKNKTKLHLMGLLQTEGVHSHMNHLFAILDLCAKQNFHDVLIHIFTDGRDSPPTDSLKKLAKLKAKLNKLRFGQIASISGRYYAMDRDKRWDRTKKAYDAIMNAKAATFENVKQAIISSHKNNITDEFIVPVIHSSYKGVNENDSIIFFNYRTDRTRQLTQSIVENKFSGFKRKKIGVFYVAMTQYYKPMNCNVAFPDMIPTNLLGEVISKNKMKQLRISETEKYAHVTFFFNGQNEKPFPGEDRILIPSPKVATYDLMPEMSVYKVSNRLVKEIARGYEFIVMNIVNADMVGHTGKKSAIKKALKAVDRSLKEVVEAAYLAGYEVLITADHGNAEDQRHESITSHTTNKIPLIYVGSRYKLRKGGLEDVAPTVLDLFGIKKPKEMTGESLLL